MYPYPMDIERNRKSMQMEYFHHYNPIYLCNCCCCCKIHSRVAAIIVGLLSLFSMVLSIALQLASGSVNDNIYNIIFPVIHLGMAIFLLIGIGLQHAKVVFIFFCWVTFGLVVLLCLIPLSIIVTVISPDSITRSITADYHGRKNSYTVNGFSLIATLFLAAAGQYWIVIVTYRCYLYLNDMKMYNDSPKKVDIKVESEPLE